MTLQEFIKKYDGHKVDFDGAFGAQCMDLYRQYAKEVWQIEKQTPPVTGAYQVFDLLPPGYIKEKNTPLGLPKAGDVITWGQGIGMYGHIAIVISATLNKVTVFEQNFPLNGACRIGVHNYKNVIGWFRPHPILLPQVVDKVQGS